MNDADILARLNAFCEREDFTTRSVVTGVLDRDEVIEDLIACIELQQGKSFEKLKKEQQALDATIEERVQSQYNTRARFLEQEEKRLDAERARFDEHRTAWESDHSDDAIRLIDANAKIAKLTKELEAANAELEAMKAKRKRAPKAKTTA